MVRRTSCLSRAVSHRKADSIESGARTKIRLLRRARLISGNAMAFSLYAATIPSYQQVLGAVSGLLGTAEAFLHGERDRT